MRSKLFLPIIALAILFSSCERDWYENIKGVGPIVSETRTVATYNDLYLGIPAEVYLYQGNDESITLDAQSNILDVIETEVRGNELKIKFRNGIGVRRHETIKIYITSRNYNRLQISGSGNIYSETPILSSGINMKISGSGNIRMMNIDAPVVEAQISGSGKINMSGFTANQYLKISGSGDIFAFGLLSETADIQISGSGKTEVNVTEFLNADISGSGSIYYKGNPSIQSKISGSGRIYPVQ